MWSQKKLERLKQFLVLAAPPSQSAWLVCKEIWAGRAPLGSPEINLTSPSSPTMCCYVSNPLATFREKGRARKRRKDKLIHKTASDLEVTLTWLTEDTSEFGV